MNIFRIDSPAASSALALKRNKRTAERAQRDALLKNQSVLENDLSGDLIACSNASMLGDRQSKNYHLMLNDVVSFDCLRCGDNKILSAGCID